MTESPLTNPKPMAAAVGLFRLLGDPTRIRILTMLADGEMNVTALCGELGLAQPTVSHHLGLLRNARLVRTRRVGKQIFYSLDPEQVHTPGDGLRLRLEEVDIVMGRRGTRSGSVASARG